MSSNLKILVVEDNLVTARGLEIKLQKIGYPNIHLARTSRECMDVLDKELVDLVLMDIELKGSDMDGIDTAKAIFETFDIPVIFLTAFTDPETGWPPPPMLKLRHATTPTRRSMLPAKAASSVS